MSEAPNNTFGTTVAFGDVVRLSKEKSKDPESDGFERYVGLEHLEPSDLKIRSWGNVGDGTTFTNVFRPGQILFGKRRAYQRKVAVADFSGVCSGDIYVLEPKGGALLPELLPFICQSEPFFEFAISMSQGGLSPRVNWKALAKYEFKLPPLDEQRRLTKVLGACQRSIESFKRSAGRLATVEYAFLRDAFGERYGLTTADLAQEPLSSLATIQTGLAKGRKADGSTIEMPYLRVANVKDGYLGFGRDQGNRG